MSRAWALLIMFLVSIYPQEGHAGPDRGRSAPRNQISFKSGRIIAQRDGVLLHLKVSRNENVFGSIGYIYSRDLMRARIGYVVHRQLLSPTGPSGVFLPLQWGLGGRIERRLLGVAPVDWAGVQLPVRTELRSPILRAILALELIPGLNLAPPEEPRLELEGRMDFRYEF